MQFSSCEMYVRRVLKMGERLVHSPPPLFFQLTIWKALIKLHIFLLCRHNQWTVNKKALSSEPCGLGERKGREENQESGEDEMANQQKRGEKREKTSNGRKRDQKERENRWSWTENWKGWSKKEGGQAPPVGQHHLTGTRAGAAQGRRAAPQSCWLFKKSRVLNLSLCCLWSLFVGDEALRRAFATACRAINRPEETEGIYIYPHWV